MAPMVDGITVEAVVLGIRSGVGGLRRHFFTDAARSLLLLLLIPPQHELPLLNQFGEIFAIFLSTEFAGGPPSWPPLLATAVAASD